MNTPSNESTKTDDTKTTKTTPTPAPFTEDDVIVREIDGTTYVLTAKYKKDAKEGLADKIIRLIESGIENDDENFYGTGYSDFNKNIY